MQGGRKLEKTEETHTNMKGLSTETPNSSLSSGP